MGRELAGLWHRRGQSRIVRFGDADRGGGDAGLRRGLSKRVRGKTRAACISSDPQLPNGALMVVALALSLDGLVATRARHRA